jgi:hypothetical protein
MEKDLWCHYSGMPSPNAYVQDADYDSMERHNRFPKTKKQKSIFSKILKRILVKRNKNKL